MSCCVGGNTSFAGATAVLLAQVRAIDQTYITQATTASLSRTIYLVSTGAVLSGPTPIVVADTVFDTLQTNYRWRPDAKGYNFRDIISGLYLGTVGELKIVYTRVDSDGLPAIIPVEHTVTAVI